MAKIATTLDIISRGRAVLGIGAGWYKREYLAYGYEFPPLGERIERLEEASNRPRDVHAGRATVRGQLHASTRRLNNPQPLRGDIPIMIGGSGERRHCGWSPSTPTAATSSATSTGPPPRSAS